MFIICKQLIAHWVCYSSQRHGLSCLTSKRSQGGSVGKPFGTAQDGGQWPRGCERGSMASTSQLWSLVYVEKDGWTVIYIGM